MASDTSVIILDGPSPAETPTARTGPPIRPGSDLVPAKKRRSPKELAGLAALLVATAIAYLYNLTSSGYANSFYAAAVQAGTKSWKAFFFGSLDSSNFITVDKPPASLWVMELSGRLLGFSSFSMLLPQVLEGVGTVALVYAIVRRWYGHRAGLLSGAVMATVPVAALMFRFNNPDALLVLLMTAAAYCVTRALEKAGPRWLVGAGVALGFAFLAKMGQALLVVPGFGLAYLVAAPTTLGRRVLHLLSGAAAMVAAAGWWVLVVTLWPASSRPMIDGSNTNSIWNLIVGYNGLERVVSSGGSAGGSNFSGSTGILRLFNSLMGGQASWLIPAAMASVVGGLILTRKAPRTDRNRAALILWGSWLVVTGLVFSYGQGVIHTYYTVALAPAIAALVGIGTALLAGQWHQRWARCVAAGVVAATAGWAVELLGRSPHWNPWLRPAIAVAATAAVVGLLATSFMRSSPMRRRVAGLALVAAVFAGFAGPVAYSLETISSAHTGSLPSAGPATSTSSAGGPGGQGGGPSGQSGQGGGPSGQSGQGGGPSGQSGQGGGPSRQSGQSRAQGQASTEGAPSGASSQGGAPSGGPSGAGQQPGGRSSQVSTALVSALKLDADKYRWVAATDGSQNAASLELASGGEPVMAIGGFNNQGGNITLAQFEKYVAAGDIHYYIVSGSGGSGGPGGASASGSITSWVESQFTSKTIGGQTVYDLTSPVS